VGRAGGGWRPGGAERSEYCTGCVSRCHLSLPPSGSGRLGLFSFPWPLLVAAAAVVTARCFFGKLLTGHIGSLCEQQPLKALRAPSGPISQYKILYYIIVVSSCVLRPLCESRQDFVAEAGASRKSVGSWELFFGT
jgi:hypothetical protein